LLGVPSVLAALDVLLRPWFESDARFTAAFAAADLTWGLLVFGGIV
jgi:hypothetical protein